MVKRGAWVVQKKRHAGVIYINSDGDEKSGVDDVAGDDGVSLVITVE